MKVRAFGCLMIVLATCGLRAQGQVPPPVIGTAEAGRNSFGVKGIEAPTPPPQPLHIPKDRTLTPGAPGAPGAAGHLYIPKAVEPRDFGFGGVFGESSSPGGKGVYGFVSVGGPNSAGVWGESTAVGGTGLVGKATGSRSTGLYASGTAHAGVFQGNVSITGDSAVAGDETFGSKTRQMINLFGVEYGIGVQSAAAYFRSANEFFWYRGGSHSDEFRNPGSGGKVLMRLGNNGMLEVPVLKITGGADLAEPFAMSSGQIPKGSVVVIDDQNAGQLTLSDREYDRRVAGVVSGANGINPGISLRQEGDVEGDQNVALTGRVYVLADASKGPIMPGDLLTTSSTPGHAMKVVDHARAQGAVLGKAMSKLDEGKGLVLVLVTLQ